MYVDVLADIEADNAQNVGNPRQHHIPNQASALEILREPEFSKKDYTIICEMRYNRS